MIYNTRRAINSLFLAIAISSFLTPGQLAAQDLRARNHKYLYSLKISGTTDSYLKLSEYFHYRESVFRAKAQKLLDEYANDQGKFGMCTKYMSKAEVTERLYRDYLAKAAENSDLAKSFDELLSKLCVRHQVLSSFVVSVEQLQNEAAGRSTTASLASCRAAKD